MIKLKQVVDCGMEHKAYINTAWYSCLITSASFSWSLRLSYSHATLSFLPHILIYFIYPMKSFKFCVSLYIFFFKKVPKEHFISILNTWQMIDLNLTFWFLDFSNLFEIVPKTWRVRQTKTLVKQYFSVY